MARMKVGVLIDSLRLGVRAGIEKAAALGFGGFQVYITGGELAPESLSRSGRREFRRHVARSGLEISALCVELGGYAAEAGLDEKIVRTQRMIDLGVDLGVSIHTAHIGRVPESDGDPTRVSVVYTTEDFFDVMGAESLVGRTFSPEDGPGSNAVAILGYGFWQRRFGGDPSVLGEALVLDGSPIEIIGAGSQANGIVRTASMSSGQYSWQPETVRTRGSMIKSLTGKSSSRQRGINCSRAIVTRASEETGMPLFSIVSAMS